jgi:hypothetical protein
MTQFEDATDLAWAAINQLLAKKDELKLPALQIQPLSEFLQSAGKSQLKSSDRALICDQAILVVDQFYAHLPFKRARYAIDPVQRLRLLRARLSQISSDLEFHSELLEAFADLRDAHTTYRLPPPYSENMAFLPFFVLPYFDPNGQRRFVVTNVLAGFDHPSFKRGAEIVQWNGMPVARAVALLAEHIPGGNPAARFMRGMMRLTVRSLASTLPPDEEVVFIRYRPAPAPGIYGSNAAEPQSQEERIIALPWYAGAGLVSKLFDESDGAVCDPLKDLAILRKILYCQAEWLDEQAWNVDAQIIASNHAAAKPVLISQLPDVFRFQHSSGGFDQDRGTINPALLSLASAGNDVPKRFGYIQIKTFDANEDAIVNEFIRILGIMSTEAPDGIILDVRGNAGGKIKAAERLLQTMTPREITPAPFYFANTPSIQDVIKQLQVLVHTPAKPLAILSQFDATKPFFEDWFADTLEAVASGNPLTAGRPITQVGSANNTGQLYYGPIVLIIDAASYSATDTFAAGFQDHRIGDIIGVDDNTGGGGATRWLHTQELVKRLSGLVTTQPPLQPITSGVGITLALQRSGRVGANSGDAVEDVGVKCDVPYKLTLADLLFESSDLISFACVNLAQKKPHPFKIVSQKITPEGLVVEIQSAGIDRVVCFIDGHPQLIVNGTGNQTLNVPFTSDEAASEHILKIEGYAWSATGASGKTLELVAAARAKLVPESGK